MKKNPMVSSIALGVISGVLTVLIAYMWSADWPSPPGLGKLSILGLFVAAVVARCVYMALVPRKAEAEPASF
ncbi:MAG: hypothetical protein AB7G39_04420 [Alphaproteobacteria bacterium]